MNPSEDPEKPGTSGSAARRQAAGSFGASIRPISGSSTKDSALATAQAAGSMLPGDS